jgi:hypothetical protein
MSYKYFRGVNLDFFLLISSTFSFPFLFCQKVSGYTADWETSLVFSSVVLSNVHCILVLNTEYCYWNKMQVLASPCNFPLTLLLQNSVISDFPRFVIFITFGASCTVVDDY